MWSTGVDQEARRTASRVVDRVTEVRVRHLDHERADLAWRAELAVQGGLAQMREKVLEDVALDVRPELLELDAVEFVDHLLEHVGIGDLQHRVAEVASYLRLVLDQRRHVGEDLVAHEIAQVVPALEPPLAPAVTLSLKREETRAVASRKPRPQLAVGLFFIEQLEVDEIRDLLDVGGRGS